MIHFIFTNLVFFCKDYEGVAHVIMQMMGAQPLRGDLGDPIRLLYYHKIMGNVNLSTSDRPASIIQCNYIRIKIES